MQDALGQQLGRSSAVEIVETVEGSPADAAGLRPEDLILEVDGSPVESVNDLQRHMVGDVIGRSVRVTVHRSGQTFDTDLVPVELDVLGYLRLSMTPPSSRATRL